MEDVRVPKVAVMCTRRLTTTLPFYRWRSAENSDDFCNEYVNATHAEGKLKVLECMWLELFCCLIYMRKAEI